jgi:hypothetical protein
MNLDERLGYCGLYCPGCGVFQATIEGPGLSAGDGSVMRCLGCNSEVLTKWCANCELKDCARDLGFRYCGECGKFPCEKFVRFRDDREYPYHQDTPAMMERLSVVGLEAWCAEQDARWNCPSCGARFDWFATACPKCGGPVQTRLAEA